MSVLKEIKIKEMVAELLLENEIETRAAKKSVSLGTNIRKTWKAQIANLWILDYQCEWLNKVFFSPLALDDLLYELQHKLIENDEEIENEWERAAIRGLLERDLLEKIKRMHTQL